MPYDKMSEYVTSLFHVFLMVNKKATVNKDDRLKMIGLTIYNYAKYLAYENHIDLKTVDNNPEHINLIPIFEYVATNNIELIEFSNVQMDDIDITKKEDLERFVLSHIYYITQQK